jgi:hypothetical protein
MKITQAGYYLTSERPRRSWSAPVVSGPYRTFEEARQARAELIEKAGSMPPGYGVGIMLKKEDDR